MKHIKLFEFFDYDYQHSPLMVDKLGMTEIELVKKTLDQMGERYYEITPIGHGSQGSAYDIGFNKIIKITRQALEYEQSKNIEGKDTENIIKVFKTTMIQIGDEIRYGILAEKLTTPPKTIIDIVDTLFFNDFPTKFELYHEMVLDLENKDLNNWLLETFETETNVSMAKAILKQIIEIIIEANIYQINDCELHGGNVAFRHNKLIYFDLG